MSHSGLELLPEVCPQAEQMHGLQSPLLPTCLVFHIVSGSHSLAAAVSMTGYSRAKLVPIGEQSSRAPGRDKGVGSPSQSLHTDLPREREASAPHTCGYTQSGHAEPDDTVQELSPNSYTSQPPPDPSIGQGYAPDKGRVGEQVAGVSPA